MNIKQPLVLLGLVCVFNFQCVLAQGLTGANLKIQNVKSGKVLEVDNREIDRDEGRVHQFSDSGGPWQRWSIEAASDDEFYLRNDKSHKLLEVDNRQIFREEGKVHQYSANGGAWQRWRIIPRNGHYIIQNVKSGKLLEVDNREIRNDMGKVEQYSDNGGDWQLWDIVR